MPDHEPQSKTLSSLEEQVQNLPQAPGVYQFFDKNDQIIYIGKASSLKNRVGSYFQSSKSLNFKTRRLVKEIERLTFILVNTENDALLLENNLIKQHQPKYNILLKDDKSYPYLCITNEPFPRIFPIRNIRSQQHTYLGPFASVSAMNAVMSLVRELYTIRTCKLDLSSGKIAEGKYKVCMEYHIKNCQGPCIGLQSEADYDRDIAQVKDILKGRFGKVKMHFKEKMQQAADDLAFEKAHYYKTKLEKLERYQNKSLVSNPNITDLEVYTILSNEKTAYINYMRVENGCLIQTESMMAKKKLEEPDEEVLPLVMLEMRQKYRSDAQRIISNVQPELSLERVQITVPQIGDLKKLLNLSMKNLLYYKREKEQNQQARENKRRSNSTLLQLKADLNLPELPEHIECFDNSNIQGTNPVAAMVCFREGKPAKKDYRHYHIKTVQGPDDFASMREVVMRRYRRLLDEQQPLPQLVVIDGGKGQLSAAVDALKSLGIYGNGQLVVVGIAKRLEEIYFPGDTIPLHIHKKSRSLALLQRVRDEAHRFAITFHRQLRSNNSLKSSLETIPGFGPATIKKLLSEFKSISNLKEADPKTLASLIGQAKTDKLLNHWKTLNAQQSAQEEI